MVSFFKRGRCNRNTVTSRDVHLQKTEACNIINLTSCLHSSLGLPIAHYLEEGKKND